MKPVSRKVRALARGTELRRTSFKKRKGLTVTSIEGVRFGYSDTPLPTK